MKWKSDRGFTLIELMVAVALISLVMGAAIRGFRSVAKSDLRSTATRVAGTMRYLFDRASTTGRIHRLVIDFEEGKYWAEVSDDRYYLPRERETEESRQEEQEQIAEEEEAAKAAEEQRQFMGESGAFDISRYQPEEFRPKRARFSAFKEVAVKPTPLKGGVKLAGLFTPRLSEPMSSGRGYVYFFPLGLTESALVYLSDDKQENFYTLVVHPLTGRVKVLNQFVEAPVEEQYDDEGNRIER